jgi:hypothetical protein
VATTLERIDLKGDLRPFYFPTRRPEMVHVPPLQYLAINGKGEPGEGTAFENAIRALYAIAYTIKFTERRVAGVDLPVMPLEARWWTEPNGTFDHRSKAPWRWTAMILMPDVISVDVVDRVAAEVAEEKALPAAHSVLLREIREGRSAQLLHVGPWSEETPSIEALHAFIADQGLRPAGPHHEIYLSDPRRTPPERLRTVIRQPATS